MTWPQVIYKPNCHYQNFSPLANGVYLIATTNKTPLRNGNCPITDPITEMGVAHTVGLYTFLIISNLAMRQHESFGFSLGYRGEKKVFRSIKMSKIE